MNQTPFPTHHDADDLNDWLDALVTGTQTPPSNEVQVAAARVHALAKKPSSSSQQPGGTTVIPATRSLPGTYRAQLPENRASTWMSAAVVAAMLISLASVAWLRGPGADQPNIAWAPQTPSMNAVAPLDPETSPWIADFDPADCTERTDLLQVIVDYSAMPESEPQGYAVAGPAGTNDALDAAREYRAMRGCATFTEAWAYWTEARLYQHPRVLTETSRSELAELQSYFAAVYPEQFMATTDNVYVSDDIQVEWAARARQGAIGQPIPLAAKLNPDWAVSLTDGRIAFPATVMYSSADPAIYLGGLPVENPASTVVMVFANIDGTWKYDDSLVLCLASCAGGMGSPLDPEIDMWVQSTDELTCTIQPRPVDMPDIPSASMPDHTDREYQVDGQPSTDVSQEITQTANRWRGCSFVDADSRESLSYLTPLGGANFIQIEQGGFNDPFEIAPYLRQRETGTAEIFSSMTGWTTVAVVDRPLQYQQFGMTWTPMFDGTAENAASVTTQDGAFNPDSAVTLSDGRTAIGYTPLVAINDRGAVTYEGNARASARFAVVLQQHDNVWLIDEILVSPSGVYLFTQSQNWWWDASFDPEPEATPATPAS